MTNRGIFQRPKIEALLLTFLLIASTLTGCGGDKQNEAPPANQGSTTDQPVIEQPVEPEISGKLMLYTSAEDAFISEVCARFNKKYPNAEAE